MPSALHQLSPRPPRASPRSALSPSWALQGPCSGLDAELPYAMATRESWLPAALGWGRHRHILCHLETHSEGGVRQGHPCAPGGPMLRTRPCGRRPARGTHSLLPEAQGQPATHRWPRGLQLLRGLSRDPALLSWLGERPWARKLCTRKRLRSPSTCGPPGILFTRPLLKPLELVLPAGPDTLAELGRAAPWCQAHFAFALCLLSAGMAEAGGRGLVPSALLPGNC